MHYSRLALASVLLSGLLTSPLTAADWPTYRHDNDRSGATPEKLQLPLKPRWLHAAPAKPRLSWSGPENRTIEGHKLRHRVNYDDALHVAIVGGRLYFGSSVDHQVRCMDLATGRQVWTFYTDGPVRLAPTMWQGQVFFGSDDGFAYSVDATNGKLIWKHRAGAADERFLGRGEMISRWPVRTGITVHDGVAYFGAGLFPHEDVFLYAVQAKTGKIVWKRDNLSAEQAGRNALSPQGYLLANDKYLFFPSGRSLPACLERGTGKVAYQRSHSWRREGLMGGTRALLADGQIYTGGEHQLLALEQKSGKVGFAYVECKEMAVDGKEGFIANGKTVARIDRLAYAKASTARQRLHNSLTSLMRRLRKPGKDADKLKKEAAKLIKEIGEIASRGIKWSTKLPAMSSLLKAGNLVFVGGEETVHALDLKTGKIVWQTKVQGEARGLAVANGYLVVSTTEGKIYVFADADQPKAQVVQAPPVQKNPYSDNEYVKFYQHTVDQIINNAKITRGFCLIVGNEQGQLAFELARRTELRIFCIEANAEKVATARKRLSQAGLYGHRVVVHQADPNDIPYPNYFANLLTSDSLLRTGTLPCKGSKLTRHVKPYGGTVCVGQPKSVTTNRIPAAKLAAWVKDLAFKEIGQVNINEPWAMFVRGKLQGSGNWTHQYGEPGNTASIDDYRVKGGLGVLWYGDPGPGKMVNRHEGAVGPLAVNGRLIVQGQFSVMAYDAYNGMFLWKHDNPKTFRTGVFQNYNASNLIASDDSVFVMEGPKVVQINAETGKVTARHELPEKYRKNYQWNYLAHQDGLLIGTATLRKELARYLKRRGRGFEDLTDAVFAIDVKTGKHLWTYKGKNIAAPTVALGPDRVYFVDSSITVEQREAMMREWAEKAKKLTGAQAKVAAARMKKVDVRMAMALDARSGKQLWSNPVDVTDCSEIGIGGGKLTLMYKDNVLLLCGANANGHYWRQFTAGEFKRRRMVALSAKTGKVRWAKDANYRHRPIIIQEKIIAEPWAFNLHSGKQIMRKHPLTGKDVPWSMYRPGHHCGMLTGAPNMLMFRSGFTGFYDLYNDSGTQHFAGHRLGCWINAIPANGLVMIPEASAGCVCQFSIASTIILEPRKARRPWTIYSSVGQSMPVKHVAVNLGAPGDRKDAGGKVWLTYPRPNPLRASGLDLKLPVKVAFINKKADYKTVNDQLVEVTSESTAPWVFTSWAHGLTQVRMPLRRAEDKAAAYTVRLYFADLDGMIKPGQRVFDVKVNGKIVLAKFDVAAARKAKQHVVIRELPGVQVERDLLIELVPRTDLPNMRHVPILNAVEVEQE